ncbi:aspartate/glutamate racemase family protein [Corynebacterium pacaense]|uniref:aspartate/glutamate racemase family protein n=1 Tax=Corynebacterium pacaense TaxID=1816684 RepID=UPI0024820C48|nr:aspartate/glutamate racemase family protein [Corynebacterium pacaense]
MPTIAVVNVNTSTTMTATISAAAQSVAAPDTRIIGVTPTRGPESVESHLEGALSAVGVIEAVRAQSTLGPPVDAWILAGYGDQGREALQELVDGPVVDITEAAAMTAMLLGDLYAVVTTLKRTVPMIRDRLRLAGLLDRCSSITATDLAVLELEADPSATDHAIIAQSREALDNGAEVICLGCGGMAGRARELSGILGAPVVDGVTAAVGLAESLIGQSLSTSRTGTFAKQYGKIITGFPTLDQQRE